MTKKWSPFFVFRRYSAIWHIASFHAWQKSVQEAYHSYCQIGTAVYSTIMQPSFILSLTITCFTLALSLTLIYSTTLSAAEGTKKKNLQSASVVPNCPLPILYFCFSLRSHKLHSFSAPVYPSCVLPHTFLFLQLQSCGKVDSLLSWPILKNHLAEREQPCILIPTVKPRYLLCPSVVEYP